MLDDKIKTALRLFFLSSIIYHLASAPAGAGAWTQPEGQGQLIATALYYRSTEFFNTLGTLQPQATYTKEELNPYVEYGLRDGLTIGANLLLDRLNDSTSTTTGLGDSEWFVRQRLYDNGHYVFSIQPEVKLPSPDAYSSHTPELGSQHVDYGARALAGSNESLWGIQYYTDVEAAYRHRSGSPHDQVMLDATLGVHVNDRITLMPQVFQTLRVQTPASVTFTESPRDDYNLTRLQLSGLYQFEADKGVQIGVFDDVAGQNVGKGMGVLIAFWKNF